MEDVTDTVFREMVLQNSTPGILQVLFTEFTSTDGLCHERGFKRIVERLEVSMEERALLQSQGVKLVAQIWGNDPENFRRSAEMISRMGLFHGIDINMGCPVKKIIKGGSCSALILNPPLAKQIIRATKENTDLPVSVKTRTGFHKADTRAWMEHLLETEPAAIILHARTSKVQSLVPADWNEISIAVATRNESGQRIPVIGNGDVWSIADGKQKCAASGAEGFMVGRGIFKDPWMFREIVHEPEVNERMEALLSHAERYTAVWGGRKPFQILKRFFKIYATGFPGAAAIRADLMQTNSLQDVRDILRNYSLRKKTISTH